MSERNESGAGLAEDEWANTATHALGFLLSLSAGPLMSRTTAGHELGMRVSCLVFAASLATVYLCSTLSHAVQHPRRRFLMRAWDQGTIYLLIAGTYSPFIWYGSPPGWTAAMMSAVWGAAAFGFYLKVIASYRVEMASTVTYVLLGWLPAVPLVSRTPDICLRWMVIGGLCYTLGIGFWLAGERVRYLHSAWHAMVMLGSASHFVAIWKLLAL